MANHSCCGSEHAQILFSILAKKSRDTEELYNWIVKVIHQMSNSCDLTARMMRKIIEFLLKATSYDSSRNTQPNAKTPIKTINFYDLFLHKDTEGNNILMILANHAMDSALREVLTNDATMPYITHSILSLRNDLNQTLLTIIEVNRKNLSESLALILKAEYACHSGDMTQAELCLSGQLETSRSSFEIIDDLHQLQPMSWCQKLKIWLILFVTWLTPNYGLTLFDYGSDAYLVKEYWDEWQNDTLKINQTEICVSLKQGIEQHLNRTNNIIDCLSSEIANKSSIASDSVTYDPDNPLEAYAACFDAQTKFRYTLIPISMPIFLYLAEFFYID